MGQDEHAIRELISLWHSATAAGDIETVASLMSEDVVFLSAGNAPIVGRAAFASGLRALLKTHRVQSSADVGEIDVSGDMAYARTKLQVAVSSTPSGQRNERHGYSLSVFRKQADGKWLLTRDANLLPPAK